MTRRFLRMVCRTVVGIVLWAQWAVAAYACPGLLPAVPAQAMPCEAMAMSMGTSGGTSMDTAWPNLCAEHCRQGGQTDQVPSLAVPAVLQLALYAIPPAPERPTAPRLVAEAVHARAAAPPHAILHCCFRI